VLIVIVLTTVTLITLDTRLREDLDADDFAVIDVVEGVVAELGERTVGLAIDDDDLVELRRLLYGLHAVLELHFAQEDEGYLSLVDEPDEPLNVGYEKD